MAKIKQVLMENQLLQENINSLKNDIFFLRNRYNPKPIETSYKQHYNQMLTTRDRLLCANRYRWTLPFNITSQQLETYYYNQGNLVYFVKDGKLNIGYYTETGTLNKWGMLNEVTPIGFDGKSYDFKVNVFNYDGKEKNTVGIISHDYTAINYCIPRAILNKEIINDQTEVYAQIKTNIQTSVHKAIGLCNNAEQADFVREQVKDILSTNNPFPVFAGNKKDLSDLLEIININTEFDPTTYTNLLDYYDKTRRAYNGVPTPDTFEKRERLITNEVEDTSAHVELILLDGYLNRKNTVELIKKYLDFEGIEELNVEINSAIYNIESKDIDENIIEEETNETINENEVKENE